MKNSIYILSVCLCLLVSCEENVVYKPDNLIAKEQMIDIYYDIALLNGANSTGSDKLEEIGLDADTYLFEKYHIDSLQLAKSSIYYTSKPNLQSEMFTEVENRLKKLKDTVDARLKKQQEIQVRPAGK